MRKYLNCGIFLGILSVVLCGTYPRDYPRCHYGDTECLGKAFNQVLKLGKNGIKEFNVPSFEPLKVPKLNIIQDTASNVAINLYLNDAEIYGISNANVYKVAGFEKDIGKSKYEFHALIPKLRIVAKYVIDGKVLILPITGNDKGILSFENVDVKIKFKFEPVVKDGKTYGRIVKYKSVLDTTKLTIQLDNLFNGNKALSDNMNNFINENWEIIFQELKPAISDAVGKIVKDIVDNVFKDVPYTDLFLED